MAVDDATRDTDEAPKSHRNRGRKQVTPDRSSGKRRLSPRPEEEVATQYQRKSQRVQENGREETPSTFISQPAGTKRKHSHDSQAEARVDKRQEECSTRRGAPFRLEPSQEKLQRDSGAEAEADTAEGVQQSSEPPSPEYQLTENNLRLFNGEMNSAGNSPSVLKRTPSVRSNDTSKVEATRSQRSASTTANYRYKHLAAAKVYIHTDPPDDIQTAIESIVEAEVPKDRCNRLREVAKRLYEACKEMVQGKAREDDFVCLLCTALEAMSPDNLIIRSQVDWREELKPILKQPGLSLSFLVDFNAMESSEQQEIEGASAPPPPKRQQQSAGQTSIYATPNRPSQLGPMPPPTGAPRKVKETSLIKTPRPDISMGTKKTALISALSALPSQNLSSDSVLEFLEKLEDTMVPSGPDGRTEPLLIAAPAGLESNLVFPFAVVECKAYSTGKQIFEAQNQAAVSGASGLKIQLSLNEIVKRSTTSSNIPPSSLKDQPPLFFSICTEGPYHELWAHYTHTENDVRKFKMKLLKICNGVLLKSVEDFIFSVDNMLRWGTGWFLRSVAERLGEVADILGLFDANYQFSLGISSI